MPRELLLRVGIILRRYYKEEKPAGAAGREPDRFLQGGSHQKREHLPLTAKEHDILQAFCRNAGRIVTIDQLCEAAWGDNPFGYENSLMAHIRRIREKIEENPLETRIFNYSQSGLGYKLVLEG